MFPNHFVVERWWSLERNKWPHSLEYAHVSTAAAKASAGYIRVSAAIAKELSIRSAFNGPKQPGHDLNTGWCIDQIRGFAPIKCRLCTF
jgi:hypothetical protein